MAIPQPLLGAAHGQIESLHAVPQSRLKLFALGDVAQETEEPAAALGEVSDADVESTWVPS